MKNKTKKETVHDLMFAPKNIDTSISFNIPRSSDLFDPKKHKFKCSSCGKGFTTQKNNFQKSNSPLYQSNDGFLPWCKDCSDSIFAKLLAFYSGNEAHAIEHYCCIVDWVYDENPIVASLESYSGHRDRSIISHYGARKNINVGNRKTYIDTLKYNYQNGLKNIITSKEQTKSEEVSISASAVDRWGIGFSEMDYKNLDEHYRMLKKNNPNSDANQEIFIKNLCNLYMLSIRALQAGDSKEYTSLTEQYSKIFTKAGLKTIQEVDNSADECLGVTLAAIAQYTPEEYYKNKTLYKDFDNIGNYFDRFVKRPLKNLMFGSNERDSEYCVKEDGDLYEQ